MLTHRRFHLLFSSILFVLFFACDKENPSGTIEVTTFEVAQNGDILNFTCNTSGSPLSFFKISYDFASNNSEGGWGMNFTAQSLNSFSRKIEELSINSDETFSFYVQAVGTDNSPSEWYGPVNVYIASFCTGPGELSFTGGLFWGNAGTSYSQIEYGPEGFSLGNGLTLNSNSNFSRDMIEEEGNIYDYYVRNYCGNSPGWSSWEGPFTHFAAANYNVCELPYNVGYFTVYNGVGQPVGATMDWVDDGNNQQYEANLVANNAAPESNAVEIVNNNTITFLSVQVNTPFDFYVRTVCIDGSKTAWVGPLDVIINY